MAKKAGATEAHRKRRTREHILEDLSIQHVRGLVLRCGFTLQRIESDYGLDVWMQTYDHRGEIEDDIVWMKLKAAESLREYEHKGESAFSYPVSTKDVRLWTGSALPVYLILYDAAVEEAYWVNVQQAVDGQSIKGQRMRLRVPRANVLGAQTIRLMQEHKNALVRWHHARRKET